MTPDQHPSRPPNPKRTSSMIGSVLPALALTFLLPTTALPGELDKTFVAADAEWVVHVDVEAALASNMAKALEGAWDSDEFAEVQQELGLDPRKDIASITLYGSAAGAEEPVIVAVGDERLEQALERLAGKAHRGSVENGGISIDRWSESADDHDAMYTYVAKRPGSSKRVLIASPTAAQVARGVRVLRGDEGNLGADSALVKESPSHGSFIYVAASEGFSRLADVDPTSQVAGLVDSAVVEAGESGELTFVRVTVGTNSEQDSRQIATIVQGGVALVSLVAQSEPDVAPLVPLVQGLVVRTDGPRVTLRFQQPTSELLELLKNEMGERMDHAGTAEEYKQKPRKAPKNDDGWY